jgi:glycosyltransferase involved in cell wall biosynthesis
MISVLIPFFNWDVTGLLEDLLIAISQANFEVEVIACDDHSPDSELYQRVFSLFKDEKSVSIFQNDNNLGRSRTRNILINKAKYDDIIFIDGDSRLSEPKSYLNRYAEALEDHAIVVGGTLYEAKAPADRSLRLHWNYGRHRESKASVVRNRQPLRYFFSNNFACQRSIFSIFPFDDSISGYGYEDSLWADEVSMSGHKIHHIDNYVIHKGLKNKHKFLEDADEAVLTLVHWAKTSRESHVNLLKHYQALRQNTAGKIVLWLLEILGPFCGRMLKAGYINLKLFDLYRLGSLSIIAKKHGIEKIGSKLFF